MASVASFRLSPPRWISTPVGGGRQLRSRSKAKPSVAAQTPPTQRPNNGDIGALDVSSCTAGSRRRAVLLGASLAVLWPGRSWAQGEELPKGYAKLAPKLVDSLLDSIQLEEDGANEFEVRRKADEAKPLVREFVSRWKEDGRLSGERSQKEIKEGLRVLGEFYMRNGQRVALPRSVVNEVRGHLLAAKAALPEATEKGFLGF